MTGDGTRASEGVGNGLGSAKNKRMKHEHVAASPQQETTSTVKYVACHTALNTVELLENILACSDVKSILLHQRVSKHWQNVVHDSAMLQRIMFLRRSTGPIKTKVLNRVRSPNGGHFRYMWPGRALPAPLVGLPQPMSPKPVTLRVLNPLLYPVWQHAFETTRPELVSFGRHSREQRDGAYLDSEFAIHDSPPCLDMYVTNPPCRELKCEIKCKIVENKEVESAWQSVTIQRLEVKNESGLKFVDVVTALLRKLHPTGNLESQAGKPFRFGRFVLAHQIGERGLAIMMKGSRFDFSDNTLLVTAEEMAAL